MAIQTYYDASTASSLGEQSLALIPKGYTGGGLKRGVILMHGAAGTQTPTASEAEFIDGANLPNLSAIIRAIVNAGYPVLAPRLDGDSWANDAAIAKVTLAKTFLQTALAVGSGLGAKSGKVHLLGASMGGALAYAWARANPTLVASIVQLQPVSDLQDMVTANRQSLASDIDAAYPAPRVDDVTVTSGSATVTDSAVVANDAGRSAIGTGIPANARVGAVTAGTSFHIQVAGADTNATSANNPRTDTAVVANGSAVVTDASITAGDVGRAVSGTGIPAQARVATVTAGVNFHIQVGGADAAATATGTSVTISDTITIDGYCDALYGATHNPTKFAAQLAGLPVQVWYATGDTTVIPATVTGVTSLIGGVDLHSFAGNHGDASLSNVDPAALVAFLDAHS